MSIKKLKTVIKFKCCFALGVSLNPTTSWSPQKVPSIPHPIIPLTVAFLADEQLACNSNGTNQFIQLSN